MTAVRKCCAAACEAFANIVRTRPDVTHERLSEAIRHIILLRNALVSERRAGRMEADGERFLQRVNAILSLASSTQFPLVGVRWDRIVALQNTLEDMLKQCGAHDDRLAYREGPHSDGGTARTGGA